MLARPPQFPSCTPLPQLHHLEPPVRAINICRDLEQRDSMLQFKSGKYAEKYQSQDYKQLYQSKCMELINEITRSKGLQQMVRQLKDENRDLQIQIKRLQEDKWQKCSTFRHSDNRRRSKSFKKLAPTIEIKVPHTFSPELPTNHNLQKSEELLSSFRVYQEQVMLYKQQIKKLKEQNWLLKQKDKQSKSRQLPQVHYPQPFQRHNDESSPTSYNHSYLDINKQKHPMISDFSPGEIQSVYTIKKDQTYKGDTDFQMKRLKNQLMYKQLLIDKLRQENFKENGVLQKHLKLTVQQSKKIADQTSLILEMFKQAIVDLSKELELEKTKNIRLQDQLQHSLPRQHQFKPKIQTQNVSARKDKNDLLGMLKTRRVQKIQ